MSEIKSRAIIQTTLNKEYEDVEFIELMRETISNNIRNNKFYSEIVKKFDFKIEDLNSRKDLEMIPFIPTKFYKESENKYTKLLTIPEKEIIHWNCSSTTSGNPSLIGVNQNDMDFLTEMSIKCYMDFLPRDWDRTTIYCFSPNSKMLDRLCMRYTKVRPVRAYSGNFYNVSEEMAKTKYLFSFSIKKAIEGIIRTRSIVGGFYVRQSYFMKVINENQKKPEHLRDYIGMGGSNHLIDMFADFLREQKVSYDLDKNFDVVTGGGGWDGHKGQMKHSPINKSDFVSKISETFGLDKKRVIDIYGFTECPVLFGSHWSEKHEDFIFHCPDYSRIIVRDIETLEPLKKPGDIGILEVLTPFGTSASIRHAITIDDKVQIVSKSSCPECGYKGDTFRILGRIEQEDGLGCSSLIKWI